MARNERAVRLAENVGSGLQWQEPMCASFGNEKCVCLCGIEPPNEPAPEIDDDIVDRAGYDTHEFRLGMGVLLPEHATQRMCRLIAR
jgi:hypothetical protein